MNTEDIIQHLTQFNFFNHGLGMPVHTSGRYSYFRVALTLVMSTRRDLKIIFERMEINDPSMLNTYDEMYHVTASLGGDEQIFHQTTETMTSEDMQSVIQTVLGKLGDPLIDTVLFG